MRHLLIAFAALLAFSAFAAPSAPVADATSPTTAPAPLVAENPRAPGEHVCTCGGAEKKSSAVCKADESCHCETGKAECRKD